MDEIPPGCILVFDKNVKGAGEYGHIEIALGDGRAVSDGITDKLENRPTALFIPVT